MTNIKKLMKYKLQVVAFITAIAMLSVSTNTSLQSVISAVQVMIAEAAVTAYGDVNDDGVINAFDAAMMKRALLESNAEMNQNAADVNGNGILDERDVQEEIHYILARSDGFTARIRDTISEVNNEIVTTNEQIETSLTAEMAKKADELGSAVAVYEYLYNNMRSEFYYRSRKGAIGAYEQGGGNDADLSSLLVAMLRYLGYDAKYVSDIVGFTEEQLLAWTSTDSIETAQAIYALQGRQTLPYENNGEIFYFCQYHYVQLIDDGQTYYLDVCFKRYEEQDTVYDAVDAGYTFDNAGDIIENTNFDALDAAMTESKNAAVALEGGQYALYDKKIVQKSFSSLPVEPEYLNGADRVVFDAITNEVSDLVEFAFDGANASVLYRSAELYNKPITISYEVSSDSKELADLLIGIDASSIFTLPAESMGQAFSVTPVLKIGDETVLTGPSLAIGDSQKFLIYVGTGESAELYEQDLTAGEMCSIIFDTGMISSNELLGGYQAALEYTEQVNQENGITEATSEDILDESNVYRTEYLGNLLRLTGLLYFSQLDIETHNLAESSGIYTENLLRFGIVGYKPEVYDTGIQKHGQYFVNILSNAVQPIDAQAAPADIFAFNFNRGLISSELESTVLEEILDAEALSTTSIFRQAEEEGIPLVILSASSEHTAADLQVDSEDAEQIQKEIDAGNTVVTIESELTCGDWSGIGYIVMSSDGSAQRYVITGGYNGGTTFDTVTLAYVVSVGLNLVLIAQTVSMLGGVLGAMTGLALVSVVQYLACIIAIELMVIEILQQTESYYEYLTQGSTEAALEVETSALITIATFGIGECFSYGASKFISSRLAKDYGKTVIDKLVDCGFEVAEINAKVKVFKNNGITKKTIQTLLSDAKSMYLSDDVVKVIGKNTGNSDLLARLVLKNGDDFSNALLNTTVLDDFCDLAWKYGDDASKVLICGDDAVAFVSRYSDNASDVIQCFKTGNVTGTSKLLQSDVSTVYTFSTDATGRTFAAGSCNYDYNPTITVPEGYFDDFAEYTGSNYYYEKYNRLLTKDYVKSMEGVSDSVKTELNKLIDALDETRRLAKERGKYNYGELFDLGYDEYSFMEKWSVSNCGEVWSAREAILHGSTFDELTYQSIYSSNGTALDMCENCIHTFTK